MTTLFALIDCNNFYVSCERLFQPVLHGKPVVVLSHNDGCVIARSDEAKALGIPMGLPAFKLTDLVKEHSIEVYSSNYTLYGTDRKYKATFSPPPLPPASAGGRCALAALAALPARRGACHSGSQLGIARLSAVWTGR